MLAESILYDSIIYWLFTLEAPIYIGYSLEKLLYMAIFHNNNIVIAMAEGPAPNSACSRLVVKSLSWGCVRYCSYPGICIVEWTIILWDL
jgi:hypothetical protein